jgi:hypothetical protein
VEENATDGFIVTKEDVDTLKNDWLTDNVRFPLSIRWRSLANVQQTIAFWEEYETRSR